MFAVGRTLPETSGICDVHATCHLDLSEAPMHIQTAGLYLTVKGATDYSSGSFYHFYTLRPVFW